MSDEDKAKPSKSVMGNLPSTRPQRMARRRDGDPVSRAAAKPTRATPKAVGKPATPAKPKPKPKPAEAAAPNAPAKPRAVRSGSPSLAAKKKSKSPRREPAPSPPSGTELVTTAVQATGELAKIGLTLGGQALKRAASRLPKP
jgi:hypothetical protein